MDNEKFEELELKSNQVSAINGGETKTTSGTIFGGKKVTDEYEDTNCNGKWDKGEPGSACIE